MPKAVRKPSPAPGSRLHPLVGEVCVWVYVCAHTRACTLMRSCLVHACICVCMRASGSASAFASVLPFFVLVFYFVFAFVFRFVFVSIGTSASAPADQEAARLARLAAINKRAGNS